MVSQRKEFSKRHVLYDDLLWVFAAGCALHDIHGSFKWALSSYISEAFTKDWWAILNSLRLGYNDVQNHLCSFLDRVLDYDTLAADDVESLRRLYVALDASNDVLDVLVLPHGRFNCRHVWQLTRPKCATVCTFGTPGV